MIPADLLDQLREKDPELWERINRVYAMRYMRQIDDPQILEFLTGKEKQSLIQGYLQEAIRARGWHLYQIRNDDLPGLPCFADIIILGHGKEHDIHNEGEGSTEAEALLRAYLAAIQVVT